MFSVEIPGVVSELELDWYVGARDTTLYTTEIAPDLMEFTMFEWDLADCKSEFLTATSGDQIWMQSAEQVFGIPLRISSYLMLTIVGKVTSSQDSPFLSDHSQLACWLEQAAVPSGIHKADQEQSKHSMLSKEFSKDSKCPFLFCFIAVFPSKGLIKAMPYWEKWIILTPLPL